MDRLSRNVSFPINYIFSCQKCGDTVTTTLPQLHKQGWIETSTFGNPNQWLCPACGRGFKKAPAESEKPSQRRQIQHRISVLELNACRNASARVADIALDLFQTLQKESPITDTVIITLTEGE